MLCTKADGGALPLEAVSCFMSSVANLDCCSSLLNPLGMRKPGSSQLSATDTGSANGSGWPVLEQATMSAHRGSCLSRHRDLHGGTFTRRNRCSWQYCAGSFERNRDCTTTTSSSSKRWPPPLTSKWEAVGRPETGSETVCVVGFAVSPTWDCH